MTEKPPFGVIVSLRHAEPMAVLASLAIAIAIFTFNNQEFEIIYRYSSTASVMFIFSFVLAVIANLAITKVKSKTESMLSQLINPGMYLFLAIGLIHLLLIAVEFAVKDLHIVNFIFGYVFLFVTMANILMYGFMQNKKTGLQALDRKWFVYVYKIFFGVAIASALANTCIFLVQGFTGNILLPQLPKVWLIILSMFYFMPLIMINSFVGSRRKSNTVKES